MSHNLDIIYILCAHTNTTHILTTLLSDINCDTFNWNTSGEESGLGLSLHRERLTGWGGVAVLEGGRGKGQHKDFFVNLLPSSGDAASPPNRKCSTIEVLLVTQCIYSLFLYIFIETYFSCKFINTINNSIVLVDISQY